MLFDIHSAKFRPQHCDPLYLYRKLGQAHDYCALLESVDHRRSEQNYSFLALGVRDRIVVKGGKTHGSSLLPTGEVRDVLTPFESLLNSAQGDRLQMGYIGFITYEAARHFENIDLTPDPNLPDGEFILPEALLRINHSDHSVKVILHEDASIRLNDIEDAVMQSPFFPEDLNDPDAMLVLPAMEDIQSYRQTSHEDYCHSVARVQEEIFKGEAFQIVISQELRFPKGPTPYNVYAILRRINPSPYMILMRSPDRTIVGASPETLLRISGRKMLYRPIAGTRKRTGEPEHDRAMKVELMADMKERCEHQMLIDLGRNDLGRVAKIGSVHVQDPFHCEQYAHVYHIVSDIVGELRDDKTCLDALQSVFPAGTLTGAPKLRAMEIIRDLEQTPRGIYGGAFGYIDYRGNMDFAITIRTMLFDHRGISFRVGAGIVKDSVPELEDNECLYKARSVLAAIMEASASP